MAKKTAFELVSPERILMSQDVEMVVVPGGEGYFGAMAGHAPLISTLNPGPIDVYEQRPERSSSIFVSGGFVEVTGDRVTVLAEGATPLDELDAGAVDQKIRDLGEDVADAKSDTERQSAERALAVAKAQRTALSR